MNINEIRNRLLHNIEKAGDDKAMLHKMLVAIEEIVTTSVNCPEIYYENVGRKIKMYSPIIVPIVCDDMFEYFTIKGRMMTIGEFICDRFDIEGEVADSIKNKLYYGISLLEQKENDDYSYLLYSEIEKEFKSGNIRLRESVKEFLKNGRFSVIVTTFGFPVIENALSTIGYTDKWFNPRHRNDIPFVKDKDSRVVYHIFGGNECGSWVYNEQTMLTFIHALHSEDYGAKNLSNYLRGIGENDTKRPLVLGSSLPDWLFRFFMYPMYGDKLNKANGYWLSLSEIEKGLDLFLKRNQYKGQVNLRENQRVDFILSEATLPEAGNDNNKKLQDVFTKQNAFISYKRVDGKTPEVVKRIAELLMNQGYDIWIDTQKVQDGGNPYWANIKKAIKDCNIFVPLITTSYLGDYINAVNIDQLINEPIKDAVGENANDSDTVWTLKPVVREAYYAVAYNKKSAPVIILDEKNNLDGNTIEKIFGNPNDNRRLPTGIFGENGAKTYLVYDDRNPTFLNLTKND